MTCSLLVQLSAIVILCCILCCRKAYRKLGKLTNDRQSWATVCNQTRYKVCPAITDDNQKTLLELEKIVVQDEHFWKIWIDKDALKTAPPVWYRMHFPPSQFPAQPVAIMGNHVIFCENTGYLPTRFQWVSLPPPGPPQELTSRNCPLSQNESGHVCFEYIIESDAECAYHLDYASDTFQIAYYAPRAEEPVLHVVSFGGDTQGVPHVTTDYKIALPTGYTIDTLTMDDRHVCIYRVSPREEIYNNFYLDIIDKRTRKVSQTCLVVPKWESLGMQQKRVYIFDKYVVLVAWKNFAVFCHPDTNPELVSPRTTSPLKLYASFTGNLPTPYYNFLPRPSTTSSFALLNFDYESNSHSPCPTTRIRLFFIELVGTQWHMSIVEDLEIPGTMQGRAMLSAVHCEEELYYALGAISSTTVARESPRWGKFLGWARPSKALQGRVESFYAIRVNLSQSEFGLRSDLTQNHLTITKMHLMPCVDEEREQAYFVDMDPHRGRVLIFAAYDRSSPESYSVAVLDYLSR